MQCKRILYLYSGRDSSSMQALSCKSFSSQYYLLVALTRCCCSICRSSKRKTVKATTKERSLSKRIANSFVVCLVLAEFHIQWPHFHLWLRIYYLQIQTQSYLAACVHNLRFIITHTDMLRCICLSVRFIGVFAWKSRDTDN